MVVEAEQCAAKVDKLPCFSFLKNVMAYMAMAYTVMAFVIMAHIAMACVAMAFIAMANIAADKLPCSGFGAAATKKMIGAGNETESVVSEPEQRAITM